ncbi:MAG: hypothetical protein BWK79_17920 [Beggiatoa sp. IS2]|nr:MAG: hypothetical protein BWK79_17920 [Beggiatoa sp. IS2]
MRKEFAPFYITYATSGRPHELLADEHLMAIISFGQTNWVSRDDPRQFTVGLPELGGGRTVETWFSCEPLEMGVHGRFAFSKNAQILFGHLFINEREYRDVRLATYGAYHDMLDFIQRQGYSHLLRVWHYFSDINVQDERSLERYQAFCLGRHQALHTLPNFEHTLPAASAIGTQSSGFLMYFLASKTPGIQVENPRQVSAFVYPRQYGPKSPSFSRAVLKQWGAENHLYISGTASIVGHKSLYENSAENQLRETLRNIDTLIESIQDYQLPIHTIADLSLLKVYVRRHTDFDSIRQNLKKVVGPYTPIVFLQGDLCRSNLLLEVEGFYTDSNIYSQSKRPTLNYC